MSTHIPQKVPEHFSRVDIGAYMRELRLHYGLSEQDVSERLHIRIKYVTAIEAANFEAMPGKAYARGYVHTYAEFLGLDADQVVERCFGGEAAHEVQEHSIPDSSNWYKRNKRYGGVLAVLLLLGGLFSIATQSDEGSDEVVADATESIESVPEEYLAGMRTHLMPTAGNYDCLGREAVLGCFRSQRLTRLWTVPAPIPTMSPAPASSYEELIDNDDVDEAEAKKASEDEKKEEVKTPPKAEPKKVEAKKPEVKKPEPKKPEVKKAEPKKEAAKKEESENEKYPGMPADYKGYYVAPKPKAAEEPAVTGKKEAEKPAAKPAAEGDE